MGTTIIYEVPGLKVSAKMRKGIEKLERKFGKLNKRFFVERNKEVRVGRGFSLTSICRAWLHQMAKY